MAKFDSKVNGQTVDGTEYSNIVEEIRNVITSTGGSLSSPPDNYQTSRGAAGYAAISDYYTDSGSANAYVLSSIGSYKSPRAYTDGMKVRFRAANANTGASTINVAGLGSTTIKKPDGSTALDSGDISTAKDTYIRYDNGNSCFILDGVSTVADSIIQVVSTQTGAVATGTTTMPKDDTIPQNTEGDEYMSLAITPTSATSKLLILVLWNGTSNGSVTAGLGLFQDSTASALAATAHEFDNTASLYQISLSHYMTSGTTSSTTFKVRVGGDSANTITFNGNGGSRLYGGVMASSITIFEIAA